MVDKHIIRNRNQSYSVTNEHAFGDLTLKTTITKPALMKAMEKHVHVWDQNQLVIKDIAANPRQFLGPALKCSQFISAASVAGILHSVKDDSTGMYSSRVPNGVYNLLAK